LAVRRLQLEGGVGLAKDGLLGAGGLAVALLAIVVGGRIVMVTLRPGSHSLEPKWVGLVFGSSGCLAARVHGLGASCLAILGANGDPGQGGSGVG